MKQQKPIVPQNQDPVWMKCRAAEHCDGNQAICTLIFKKNLLQGGGTTRRYRCQTCKGTFTVTV
jgi:hypothetical protein